MAENKYKLTFGRKFLGMLLGIIVLTAAFVFTGILIPVAINASVVITFFFLVAFLVTAYIGGNVYGNFVKSKFFQSERYNGVDK